MVDMDISARNAVLLDNVYWCAVVNYDGARPGKDYTLGGRMKSLQNHADVICGLLACGCSLAVLVEIYISGVRSPPNAWTMLALPFFWVVCMVAAARSRQRPAGKLWWVWISGPIAFYEWLRMIGTFFY